MPPTKRRRPASEPAAAASAFAAGFAAAAAAGGAAGPGVALLLLASGGKRHSARRDQGEWLRRGIFGVSVQTARGGGKLPAAAAAAAVSLSHLFAAAAAGCSSSSRLAAPSSLRRSICWFGPKYIYIYSERQRQGTPTLSLSRCRRCFRRSVCRMRETTHSNTFLGCCPSAVHTPHSRLLLPAHCPLCSSVSVATQVHTASCLDTPSCSSSDEPKLVRRRSNAPVSSV